MMMKKIISCLLVLLNTLAFASDYQSIDRLKKQAYSYINLALTKQKHKQFDIRLGKLDSRLKLTHCDDDNLHIEIPHNRSLLTASNLIIQCNQSPNDWKIYLPFKVKLLSQVVITKRTLSKNHQITADDLQVTSINVKKLRNGYFSKPDKLIGLLTTKTLYTGHMITQRNLKRPQLIYRGQKVKITVINKAISVSMKGIAIENGKLGDIIRVKNLSSSRIIQAEIVTKHRVVINI